ncbi:TPA: hypothetical protein DDW35_07175 [Candidatus Sumerlaeota bacterium]|nr:hypothetical protein [Candidatus Sumerlaeota bacterium]
MKPILEGPVGPTVRIDGQDYDYYCGGGYLGLYDHPHMIAAACEATERYGFRLSGPSSLAVHPPVTDLIREASIFFGTETASYNPSGYDGAGMLASALKDVCDVIFLDAESHFSVMEGATLAGKPIHFFAHCNAGDLAQQLRDHLRPHERPLLMTDGMFPITGEIPPLPAYVEALNAYDGALLCVDDAHAAGVLGKTGRGSLEHFGLEGPGRYQCATLSKAFGAYGGLIPCSEELLGLMRKNSMVFRGSACPSPGLAAACAKSLQLVREQPHLRESLANNTRYLRERLHAAGLAIDPAHPSPIIALDKQNKLDLKATQERLYRERHICTTYYAAYANTPQGGAMRIAVFANHTREQLDRLVEAVVS